MTLLLAPAAVGEWRRLSPRMLLVHPVVELGRALPALAGAFLAGRSSGGNSGTWWSLGLGGVVIVFALLRWFTTSFRITAEQIQLRHGLLRRRTVAAPVDRVRTVDVTAHLLHRLLGLAKVAIGTGTSDRKGRNGLVLDGLGADAAAALRAELLHRRPDVRSGVPFRSDAGTEATTGTQAPELVLARLDRAWIRYAPFTLSGALTGLALLGVGSRIVNEGRINLSRVGPLRTVAEHFARWPLAVSVAVVAVCALVFVAVASTLGYVLAFWNFRLTRHSGGTLHVTRGLLTSRATSIERRRLRGAELSEPLLLRAAGGARCLAIATGLRVGRGAERGGEILLPPAPRAVALRVGADVLEQPGPLSALLQPHPPAALRRRLVRAVGAALVVVAVIAVIDRVAGWPLWAVPASGVLIVLAIALGIDRYRSLGHAYVDGFVVSRLGSLVRRRSAVISDGVIGWNLRSTFFQRRIGLVTLTATAAAGRQRYRIVDLAAAESADFADRAVPGLLAEFLG